MGTINDETRPVAGGAAAPSHITNDKLPATGGPTGVQPVSVSDGADVAMGAKADAAASSDGGTFSLISLVKRLLAKFGTGTSSLTVQGTAADGAAAVGNPVQVGGMDGSSNVQALATETNCTLKTTIYNSSGTATPAVRAGSADNVGVQSQLVTAADQYNWNGSGNDRVRNNHEVTALASAARTASTSSGDLTNYNHRGVVIVIDVTLVPGAAPSLVFTIRGKSSLGSDYYTILASVAITATGQTVLRIHPELTAAANTIAKDVLPRIWDIDVAAGNANSATYSVSVNYVP